MQVIQHGSSVLLGAIPGELEAAMFVASTEDLVPSRPPASSRPAKRKRGRPPSTLPAICRICGVSVGEVKCYWRRHRVCQRCATSEEVVLPVSAVTEPWNQAVSLRAVPGDMPMVAMRFCFQHGRCHPLEEFRGKNRNCFKSLCNRSKKGSGREMRRLTDMVDAQDEEEGEGGPANPDSGDEDADEEGAMPSAAPQLREPAAPQLREQLPQQQHSPPQLPHSEVHFMPAPQQPTAAVPPPIAVLGEDGNYYLLSSAPQPTVPSLFHLAENGHTLVQGPNGQLLVQLDLGALLPQHHAAPHAVQGSRINAPSLQMLQQHLLEQHQQQQLRNLASVVTSAGPGGVQFTQYGPQPTTLFAANELAALIAGSGGMGHLASNAVIAADAAANAAADKHAAALEDLLRASLTASVAGIPAQRMQTGPNSPRSMPQAPEQGTVGRAGPSRLTSVLSGPEVLEADLRRQVVQSTTSVGMPRKLPRTESVPVAPLTAVQQHQHHLAEQQVSIPVSLLAQHAPHLLGLGTPVMQLGNMGYGFSEVQLAALSSLSALGEGGAAMPHAGQVRAVHQPRPAPTPAPAPARKPAPNPPLDAIGGLQQLLRAAEVQAMQDLLDNSQ